MLVVVVEDKDPDNDQPQGESRAHAPAPMQFAARDCHQPCNYGERRAHMPPAAQRAFMCKLSGRDQQLLVRAHAGPNDQVEWVRDATVVGEWAIIVKRNLGRPCLIDLDCGALEPCANGHSDALCRSVSCCLHL